MPLPQDIERHITGEFNHGTVDAIMSDPLQILTFCCCAPCSLFSQRQRILAVTKEPYVCCGGAWPLCGLDKPVPEEWLCVEACCLQGAALAGNRFLMQTRFNRRNSKIDNVLSFFHCCVACECAIARLCMDCSVERENLCKSLVCVCPVSHCQVGADLADIEKTNTRYNGPSPGLLAELPVHYSLIGARAPAQMKMDTVGSTVTNV